MCMLICTSSLRVTQMGAYTLTLCSSLPSNNIQYLENCSVSLHTAPLIFYRTADSFIVWIILLSHNLS